MNKNKSRMAKKRFKRKIENLLRIQREQGNDALCHCIVQVICPSLIQESEEAYQDDTDQILFEATAKLKAILEALLKENEMPSAETNRAYLLGVGALKRNLVRHPKHHDEKLAERYVPHFRSNRLVSSIYHQIKIS